jgi:tetratricopeptide (TPR) repeat protein
MKSLLVVAFLVALPVFGQVSEGDQHWAARAEGHQGGHAKAAQIDAAIAAYQKAIGANPNDLEPRWKLLRAIRFQGAYVATTNDQKKQVYTSGKNASASAMAVVARLLATKSVRAGGAEKDIAAAARSLPGAGEIYFWDSVLWGEWALAYGKMAAVREGAADHIRRNATIANLINPNLEAGGPSRVLGRLHDQTPHVPFLTGWASSKEAVRFLTEATRIAPANKLSRLFLAEAMVNRDSDAKPQAVQMLRDVISAPNDPAYEVEDAAAQDDARALLKRLSS